jgi:hypothetical protein
MTYISNIYENILKFLSQNQAVNLFILLEYLLLLIYVINLNVSNYVLKWSFIFIVIYIVVNFII